MTAPYAIKTQIMRFRRAHQDKRPLFLEISQELYDELAKEMRSDTALRHLVYEGYVVYDGVEIFPVKP
jgi:hypothetical protein